MFVLHVLTLCPSSPFLKTRSPNHTPFSRFNTIRSPLRKYWIYLPAMAPPVSDRLLYVTHPGHVLLLSFSLEKLRRPEQLRQAVQEMFQKKKKKRRKQVPSRRPCSLDPSLVSGIFSTSITNRLKSNLLSQGALQSQNTDH